MLFISIHENNRLPTVMVTSDLNVICLHLVLACWPFRVIGCINGLWVIA